MNRNAYFDNARVFLIFLVVFGHLVQPFTDGSNGMNTLYLWIYTFHMPAFIFLAGFFAKGSGNWKYIFNLAKKLLVPYLIFQLLYTAYYFFIGKEGWESGIFYPQWSLWFLFSLFSWHILLIGFKKLPAAAGIISTIAIGLVAGYFGDIGHTFSLSRTIVFFPFFLMGYWMTKDQVLVLKRKGLQIAAVVVLVGVAAGIYIAPDFNSGWLLASKSYGDLGLPEFGGLARLLVYGTSFAMSFSVLALIPQSHSTVTKLGARTLYVYLLHGFFIQLFREANVFEVSNFFDVIGLAVIAAFIVWLLSSRPIQGIWQPFIEGKASILKDVFGDRGRKGDQHFNT
ncbi:acyltransferase family protein [Virgibacillus ihumii]|uniref:acyltransferase family protein n=1 Tax=Virgibacillus ihumii TaxID=2686091 RepID=UPI00157DC328|nr:acyltransferase family protein [Virgibacillus ihumii]